MPRTVAPVQPYMADNSAILKASQAGWEMGMKMPTTAGSIMAGVQQGMQMANQVASFQDKYGAEAQAAKARKAEMEGLQIQQAQQNLQTGAATAAHNQTVWDATDPYLGQNAKNNASQESAQTDYWNSKAKVAGLDAENYAAKQAVDVSNDEVKALENKARLLDMQTAAEIKKNQANSQAETNALINDAVKTKDPAKFTQAWDSMGRLVGTPSYDAFSQRYKAATTVLPADQRAGIIGTIDDSRPTTIAGVNAEISSGMKQGAAAEKDFTKVGTDIARGGTFTTDAEGNQQKITDYSGLRATLSENFGKIKTYGDGTPKTAADGQPDVVTPNMADVANNLRFEKIEKDGSYTFKNASKKDNNTFNILASDGKVLQEFVTARDAKANITERTIANADVARYMTENQKHVITDAERAKVFNESVQRQRGNAPTTPSDNGTTAAGGGNGVLPALPANEQPANTQPAKQPEDLSSRLNKTMQILNGR